MFDRAPKPPIAIPSERASESAKPRDDRSLAVLNAVGRSLIQSQPPRHWDGETIPLARFRLS